MYGSIFFEVAVFILEVGVESRHVGKFGELDEARRTTRRFAKTPLITFNFTDLVEFGYVSFDKKIEFFECTRRLAKCLL